MYEKDDKESLLFLLTILCSRMKLEGHVIVPFVTVDDDVLSDIDVHSLKEGDSLQFDQDVRIRMDTVTEGKDEEWFCLFTNVEELRKQQTGNVIIHHMILISSLMILRYQIMLQLYGK